ncbi:MAG: hypothetical protein GY925_12815 [Actinomycetia bacterium]|nr:hypothetical protein [Actinomycetes bacterium]
MEYDRWLGDAEVILDVCDRFGVTPDEAGAMDVSVLGLLTAGKELARR